MLAWNRALAEDAMEVFQVIGFGMTYNPLFCLCLGSIGFSSMDNSHPTNMLTSHVSVSVFVSHPPV